MASRFGIPESRSTPSGSPEQAAADPQRRDMSLMLCVACGLIVNSHLERFWPRSFFAVDGLLGNSFFYLLSGYGIGASLFARPQRFGPFLARRLARIYPAVVIAGVVLLSISIIDGRGSTAVNGQAIPTLDEAFRALVWPTPFTYVRNIIAIYVIGYVAALPRSGRMLFAALAAAVVLFLSGALQDAATLASDAKLALGSVPTSIYDCFDTALFLGGMIAAWSRTKPLRHGRAHAVLAAVLCIGYFALKYAMVAKGMGGQYYPVLFALVAAVSYLAIGVLSDPAVMQSLRRVGWLAWAVDLVAGLTLEIYVVHQTLISIFPNLAAIRFPLNIVVLVLSSVAAAAMVRLVTAPLRTWVDGATRSATTA